jgi:hypothetical protein
MESISNVGNVAETRGLVSNPLQACYVKLHFVLKSSVRRQTYILLSVFYTLVLMITILM